MRVPATDLIMETALVVALIAGAVSISAATIAIVGNRGVASLNAKLARENSVENRQYEAQRIVARYREPLARAAYDLQSRLYNILEKRLIEDIFVKGTARDRAYITQNTVFVIAQYFAWTEIMRREVQFLDLGEVARTRSLAALQDKIYSTWRTDGLGRGFRIYAGEQRALGEALVVETERGLECMGFGRFAKLFASRKVPLLNVLAHHVKKLQQSSASEKQRLVYLQNHLIDLLDFLDPLNIRFPKGSRAKAASRTEPAIGNNPGTTAPSPLPRHFRRPSGYEPKVNQRKRHR